jgi:hypothetical protein
LNTTAANAAPLRIVAIGASNTHGWYVGNQGAYPAQLQALLRAKGIDAQVTNAGVPFDTTAMMLRRFSIKLPAILGAGFSSVLHTPSRQLSVWPFLYETAIDDKIFARHPPCRESFLEALPNCPAREPR